MQRVVVGADDGGDSIWMVVKNPFTELRKDCAVINLDPAEAEELAQRILAEVAKCCISLIGRARIQRCSLRELVVKLQGELAKPHFAGIRAAAKSILLDLEADEQIAGADYCVNWADLHVTEVLRTLDEDGQWSWQVHIEEGKDQDFCNEVSRRLKPDWGTVRVMMEW